MQIDGYSLDAQKTRMRRFVNLMITKSPGNTKMQGNPIEHLFNYRKLEEGNSL